MKPKNQADAVLHYIQTRGEIDFLIAARDLGVSQLTARIADLNRKGWTFDKRTVSGKNRYGNKFSKVIYSNARKRKGFLERKKGMIERAARY
jgi:hypothetical protein